VRGLGFVVGCAVSSLAACQSPSPTPTAAPSASVVAAVPLPAPVPVAAAPENDELLASVDFEEQASKEVTPQNLVQELEELEKEVGK
jgi:hypothetical protein